jgi:hypothetical protein
MVRKRTADRTLDGAPDEQGAPPPAVEEVSDEETEVDQSIDALLSSLGGEADAKVYVYRIDDKRKQRHVTTVHPSDFSLDMLHELYPQGGDFRLLIHKDGRYVKGGHRYVSIDPTPGKDRPAEVIGKAPTDDPLIKYMLDQSSKSEDRMVSLLSAALGKDSGRKQASIAEIITAVSGALVTVKELLGGGDKGNITKELLQMLREGMELGREAAGSKGGTSLNDVLKGGVEALAAALGSKAGGAVALPAPGAAPGTQQENQGDAAAMYNAIIKAKLEPLVEAAKLNEDPGAYVGIIFAKVAPEYIKQWVIDNENPIVKLAEFHPEVLNYQQWFEQLIVMIREDFAEEQQAAD